MDIVHTVDVVLRRTKELAHYANVEFRHGCAISMALP